ncbi:hypothetical protein [Streptomyces sp. NPDC015345]|uniref:hypothetical protein n=1 Tax=Streptomyces sp. NPDC015345 TaxID=3364953 RepID=UPI0036F7C593
MSPAPYAVRVSAPAAKVLDTLPEHAVDTVWDILAATAAEPWGFRQFDTTTTRARTSAKRPSASSPSPSGSTGPCAA